MFKDSNMIFGRNAECGWEDLDTLIVTVAPGAAALPYSAECHAACDAWCRSVEGNPIVGNVSATAPDGTRIVYECTEDPETSNVACHDACMDVICLAEGPALSGVRPFPSSVEWSVGCVRLSAP